MRRVDNENLPNEKSYNVPLTHVTLVREFIEERAVAVDLLDLSCG